MKILLIVVAVLVGVAVVVTIVGALMPRTHVATSEISFRRPIAEVYSAVRDIGGMTKWWGELRTSERVSGVPGERWRQEAGGFAMQLDVTDDRPPHGFVTNIVQEKGAPFGGKWIYALTEVSGVTTLRVSEDGWIGPPPFRVMAKVMGLHRTIDGMLVALARKFGEDAKPVHKSPG